MMRPILLLTFVCWISVGFASEIRIDAQNPRPFGYVVGDTFEQELTLTAARALTLDRNKLPKPNRLNAWLELRNIDVSEKSSSTATQYRIKLQYQLPNAPTEVRVIELPAHQFSFSAAGKKSVDVRSIEWPITIGPITPPEVLARDGLEALRPDVVPRGVNTGSNQQRILISCIGLAALLLYWCYRYFGVPFLAGQRRPFTQAYRQLSRLARREPPDAFPRAIAHLHQALNETAGKSLFIENIESFLSRGSIPNELAEKTREFFRLSREEFFAGGVPDSQRTLAKMLDFCKSWRDVERGIG